MIETDALGSLEVDENVYYGINAIRNSALKISPYRAVDVAPRFIKAFFQFKKAAAQANLACAAIGEDVCEAICQACDEAIGGAFNGHILVDMIQGNSDVATNMNINEILAKRANEILKGDKHAGYVMPNDHVSCNHSTTDIAHAAHRITCYDELGALSETLNRMATELERLTSEHAETVRLARPVWRDSIPMTYGQYFGAWASNIRRLITKIPALQQRMYEVPIGATMFGSGIGSVRGFGEKCTEFLAAETEIALYPAKDMFDIVQNNDDFLEVANLQQTIAGSVQKIVKDVRMLGSGPKTSFNELRYVSVTPGSSIMPGKLNPVVEELVIQANMKVLGNTSTVAIALADTEFECNPWVGIMTFSIFESFCLMNNAYRIFTQNILSTLEVNKEQCEKYARSSTGVSVFLSPIFGYKKAAEVAKLSYSENCMIEDIVVEMGLMEKEDARKYLDPMTFISLDNYFDALEEAQAKYGKRNL